jgi:hypothetical protein
MAERMAERMAAAKRRVAGLGDRRVQQDGADHGAAARAGLARRAGLRGPFR